MPMDLEILNSQKIIFCLFYCFTVYYLSFLSLSFTLF